MATARYAGGRGALTAQWRQATEQEVARLRQEAQARRGSRACRDGCQTAGPGR